MMRISRLTRYALLIATASCANAPMNSLRPASDLGDWIASLYWETIGWLSLVLALVVILVILVLARHSSRMTEAREPPVHVNEHLMLEAAWTVAPAGILLLIAFPAIVITFDSLPNQPPANALHVVVIAHQWWWEYRYPEFGIDTADEAHVVVNRPVYFELHSADVIHSFWVPKLGGKRDVIPNHTNELILTPYLTGEYYGQCAEFCGLSHANMKIRVFVDSPERFRRWVENQRSLPVEPSPATPHYERIESGMRIFEGAPCAACHEIRGLSRGTIGPNLTHIGSHVTLGGGLFANTPSRLGAWIEHPDLMKPGVEMPGLALSRRQLSDLVAYLESLH